MAKIIYKDLSEPPSPDEAKKILLYGEPGVGKTYALRSVPAICFPMFILDFDWGTLGIRNHFPPGSVYSFEPPKPGQESSPQTLTQAKSAIAAVEKSIGKEIRTIVLDSFTTFYMGVMEYVKHEAGKERTAKTTEPDFGAALDQTVDFMNVVIGSKRHVIATAHERMYKMPVSGRSKGAPALTGQLANIIPSLFDEIVHCEAITNRDSFKATWWTKPHDGYIARTRLQLPTKIEPDLSLFFSRVKETQNDKK